MKNLIIVLMTIVSTISFAQTAKKAPPKPVPPPPHAAGHAAPPAPGARMRNAYTRNYGLAGCGLGSVLMGKRGAQIFAATTNGTFSNQMTGISAGTLNCLDSASAEVAGRMDQFILVNRPQLQGDIARGQGETIAALENFMGCNGSSQVGSELKLNYSEIFQSDVPANEITDQIITVIKSSPELSQQCTNLG